MRETNRITQTQIINQLLKIGHRDLTGYTEPGLLAAKYEPDLLAHMIAWNQDRGQIRDTKVALPVLALRGPTDNELFENAVAHLCRLSPRDLIRATDYHRQLAPVTSGGGKWLKRAVSRYITEREAAVGWWDRTALQHRRSLKALYARFHIKPNPRAQAVLFDRQRPSGSVFEAVAQLATMDAKTAAGTILNRKMPFLIAVGAIGGIKHKTDLLLALVENMSGAELINNTAALKRWGVLDNPTLKAAYDAGIERAKADKKVSTLKAGKAAKVVGGKAGKKLEAVQESKLQQLGGIDGDWLVLGDRSGSMHTSIEVARQVAALIAQQVKGRVQLVFFNTRPMGLDVTGFTLDQINDATRNIRANGGTSIGCGLDLIRERGMVVNGIAICSDGGDNTRPRFYEAYRRYADATGIEPTVYLFHVPGDDNYLGYECQKVGISIEEFELGARPDYYALPELIKVMRTSKYSLVDEIMETRLLTLDKVFKRQ